MIKANINNEELLRLKIVKLAMLQLNKRYEHGSMGPDSFDCAGLVWYVYHEILGINLFEDGYGLSTTTKIMTSNIGELQVYKEDDLNKDLSTLNIGDVLLFHRQSKEDNVPKNDNKYPGHCGIYLGDNNFIHCPRKKGIVLINNLEENPYWQRKLVAKKDIIKKTSI